MKRLLIALVLVLVLLTSQVMAADVLETWSDYSIAARRKLGLDTVSTGYLTDANARAFIREAVVQIVPISGARKEITTIITGYKDYTYTLDSTLVEILAIWWSKNDSIKTLQPLPPSAWSSQPHKTTEGHKNSQPFLKRPSFYHRVDTLLLIFPPPAVVWGDTLRIEGIHRIKIVLTDSTLTEIPQQYRIPVLNYVTWCAAFARQDTRTGMLFQVLDWSLGKLGLSIIEGGQVVPSNK